MKTHYDVLNLEKNCSAKEIKESFIKLSKKYHPDINKSWDAHKKFVEVNEAYSVLGKPWSRNRYDETLSCETMSTVRTSSMNKTNMTQTAYEHYCEMYAKNLRKNQETSQGYFTRSKLAAVCFCLVLMTLGSGLQIVAETHRRRLRSHQIAVALKETRDQRYQRQRRQREMHQAVVMNEPENLNTGEPKPSF